MSNRKNRLGIGAVFFFSVAGISLIVALLLAFRGREFYPVFLGNAVVFFVVGLGASRMKRGDRDSGGAPPAPPA